MHIFISLLFSQAPGPLPNYQPPPIRTAPQAILFVTSPGQSQRHLSTASTCTERRASNARTTKDHLKFMMTTSLYNTGVLSLHTMMYAGVSEIPTIEASIICFSFDLDMSAIGECQIA